MRYSKTLTLEQDDVMQVKATAMGQPVVELFDLVLDRYVADCARDVGRDVDSNIMKRLAEMTPTEKTALLATLPIKEGV